MALSAKTASGVGAGVMRAKSESEVREEHPALGTHLKHWDGAQVLLGVIRKGSLRRAAEAMSIPVMVARRRIEALEREIGASLFVRDGRGTRLTRDGEQVFAAVERMEAASLDLVGTQNSALQSLAGPVRLRVPDSIGSFWLAPRLAEFQRAFPKILIDLDCTPRTGQETLRDTDVVLTLGRPLIGADHVKLGRIHWALFASHSYIEAFGVPASAEEMPNHRWLLHAAGSDEPDLIKQWFPERAADELLVMKSSASSAHYFALAQGVGLGALPTYLRALGSNLVALEVGLKHSADVWLSSHSGSKRLPRVLRMIDWMVETFNPVKFPWFRDEFVHPDKLAGLTSGAPCVKLFENSSGGGR